MQIGKNYYFRKSDLKMIIILLLIATVCILLLLFLGRGNLTADGPASDSAAVAARKDKAPGMSQIGGGGGSYAVAGRRVERFVFDPNTADSTALLRLGLQPWQVRNIYKYRAAGGIYRKPSDFARLYGLTVKQYRELEPYIRISADYAPASTLVKNEAQAERFERDTLRYPVKLKAGQHIDLNTADTSQLKKVPGIGSGFARAIIGHGERLGGFVSLDQLDEINGFPEEAKAYFELRPHQVRKLNVNTLSLNDLKRHPYMGFYRARAIVDYRRLHGSIRSVDELRMLDNFSADAVSRLRPYIEF